MVLHLYVKNVVNKGTEIVTSKVQNFFIWPVVVWVKISNKFLCLKGCANYTCSFLQFLER